METDSACPIIILKFDLDHRVPTFSWEAPVENRFKKILKIYHLKFTISNQDKVVDI